jgi:hypothetical protein
VYRRIWYYKQYESKQFKHYKGTSVRTARVQKKSSKAAVSDHKKTATGTKKRKKKAKKPITAAKLYA